MSGDTPTFEDYLDAVSEAMATYPLWRAGQTYFNVLFELRPDISEGHIRAQPLDPFYDDRKLPGFLVLVKHLW